MDSKKATRILKEGVETLSNCYNMMTTTTGEEDLELYYTKASLYDDMYGKYLAYMIDTKDYASIIKLLGIDYTRGIETVHTLYGSKGITRQDKLAEHEKTYNFNNGKVCLVDDGRAILIPSFPGLIDYLEENGFKESSDMFVPCSNGELPTNNSKRAKLAIAMGFSQEVRKHKEKLSVDKLIAEAIDTVANCYDGIENKKLNEFNHEITKVRVYEEMYGKIIANLIDEKDSKHLIEAFGIDLTVGDIVAYNDLFHQQEAGYRNPYDITKYRKSYNYNNGKYVIVSEDSVTLVPSFDGIEDYLKENGYKIDGRVDVPYSSASQRPKDPEVAAKYTVGRAVNNDLLLQKRYSRSL